MVGLSYQKDIIKTLSTKYVVTVSSQPFFMVGNFGISCCLLIIIKRSLIRTLTNGDTPGIINLTAERGNHTFET
jgi:hypothetical protein